MVYYLEKDNGIFFTDEKITIIDGLFFKKKYIYKYENLKELNIKMNFGNSSISRNFYLKFDDGFKYNYDIASSVLRELLDVKDFLREKGIYVDDDSEPPVFGR